MSKNYPSLSSKSPEMDWTYSVQLNHWFLKPIGAWPFSFSITIADKIISIGLITISSCLIGFLLVPCALCAFLDREGDVIAKIRMIGPLSFFIMAAAKYCILLYRGNDIARCIEHVRLDWERASNYDKDREIVVKNAEFGRSLVILCAVFMYGGGVFFFTIVPLCVRRTEIIDNETIRVPSFPIYRKLIDPRSSPYIEIVQFLQSLASYVVCSITISACSLAAVFVMHACGQFRILMYKLDNFVMDEEQKSKQDFSDKGMGDIVEYHLRILRYVSFQEWEHNETIRTLTFCTLLMSFTFNIFILCYIGELLVEQCKNVGITSYMIDWYRLPRKKALGLILIIASSNSPIKLTAGKLFELSLASFCSVVKSAVGYLSLLRTLDNEMNMDSLT
ncbi:hypothetical protein KPH14_009216 [Odynerus spinipes]|uniref:Odorant receptor n=1 Tax=Odynerus spinipes TaxID=1348599 RepID=A0AAD9RP27_9HYME|nr:hypothetical protein KPH14_009216 [Odynerus spinipes]